MLGPVLIDKRFAVFESVNEIHWNLDENPVEIVKIEPRIMQVLKLLMTADGKMVSREILLKEVWQNYEGGEEGLNQAISKLRKIFQDDHRQPKVIETISKKGYRMLCPIELPGVESLKEETVSEIPSKDANNLIRLIDYLKKPAHLIVFIILSAVLISIIVFLYKIIYAIAWS